jgi:flagellar hook-associated protein 1 FlgK
MSLSSAISTAQSMLSNTAKQTSIISQNLSGAGNADYARRDAILSSVLGGSQVVTIRRAQNQALLNQLLAGTSASSGQDTLLSGLEKINASMGGNDYGNAPSTLIGKLRDALQTFAAQPSNITSAQSAVAAASDLAKGLNAASQTVQQVRSDADSEIATGVDTLNTLLARFETVNNTIIRGTQAGTDINDALDQRDKLLKSISSYVGIDTVTRANNDTVIYTKDGTTLFETVPRTVSFATTPTFSAGETGNSIYIDGVPLKAGEGADTTASGSLQGLLQLRDEVAPQYQSQLDEIARGLVRNFAESDGSGATKPGLFTWADGNVPPDNGTLVDGLAASISVNPDVDPEKGGDPNGLRDGNINGTTFLNNTNNDSGYSKLLNEYITGLDTPMDFDPSAGIATSASVLSFSSDSIGWLEQYRSNASDASENKDALTARSTQALSNATGVSIDEELSRLLDLEQSYKASAKLIATTGQMLDALLQAAG